MIAYPLGESGQILVFSDVVLEHFKTHRQIRAWHREAGGQLFARIDGTRIIVVEATGPRRGDLVEPGRFTYPIEGPNGSRSKTVFARASTSSAIGIRIRKRFRILPIAT